MSEAFSSNEKAELRSILENPTLQKAFQQALTDVWKDLGGAQTLEAAALAYKHQEGATAVLKRLHAFVEVRKDFTVNPRKLKHTTHIP